MVEQTTTRQAYAHELTDDELAQVVGGNDGPPTGTGTGNGKASPQLML